MNSKSKRELVDKIESEMAVLRKDIDRLKELTAPIAPENAIGRVSRMDAINNKSVNDAALNKAKQKLSNLKVELSNINDPDFGVCFKCKNNIPIGRILLMPHTRFCVQCAS